ncbi:MAG: cob(I)yrinic acid a,c-diamide adenosyltransferase [Bdellovibrionaceae bacterium]|nr:cob(I)yrinic acid a,c-diamide adenosyltransferase [Pseudobdellovibrionaceae bacterium]
MADSNKKSKIYTRTGDKGTTRLVDGSCVEKFNLRVEAYGTVDELNSYLGVVRLYCATPDTESENIFFSRIQNHLFRVGSLLACADANIFKSLPPIESSHIDLLEKKIDELDSQLPPLKNFILPFGDAASTHSQYARTLCRRAERRTAEVIDTYDKETQSLQSVLIYLNRLSDLLFVYSRWFNLKSQHPEMIWNKEV